MEFGLRPRAKLRTSLVGPWRYINSQQCYTISEVAADWHELMKPQHDMRPSIAPRVAACMHADINSRP